MVLPASGPLSLDDIHVEAGGTTGTLASINDADIRALIGKASGVAMSFSEWYGASALITLVAQSNNTTGPTTSTTVTLPTFAAGDIAVATIACYVSASGSIPSNTISAPSGWTAVTTSQNFSTGPFGKAEERTTTALLVCYKVLTAGDTSFTNISTASGGSRQFTTTVQIYRPSSTPSSVTSNDVSTASSNTINCSTASSSVIMFAAQISSGATTHTWGSGPTYNSQLSQTYGSPVNRADYHRGSSHFQSTATPSDVTWSGSTTGSNRYVSGFLEIS